MDKRLLSLLVSLALVFGLAACGLGSPAASEAPAPAGSPLSSPALSSASPAEPAADSSAMLSAYQSALNNLAQNYIMPDGSETGFDPSTNLVPIEENVFAVADVDGDGAEELILYYIIGPMAANRSMVLGFDEASGQLCVELSEYPSLTFYTNGSVKAELSHNQGLAGDGYWPYSLYHYDPASDSYVFFASVDMWTRSLSEVDSAGEPYPDDLDADGSGTVFLLSVNGVSQTLNKQDYENWCAENLGAAAQDISFLPLTAENIAALTQ